MLSNDVLHVPDPLWLDDSGVVRVRDTRVPFDVIVHAHYSGMEPEAIARAYDAVGLPDVYAVISCYLRHRAIFDEYLQRRREEAARQQAEIEARQPPLPGREELLARRRARETDHAQAGQ
jgi:uncharacterized protein (DUF433 family)